MLLRVGGCESVGRSDGVDLIRVEMERLAAKCQNVCGMPAQD